MRFKAIVIHEKYAKNTLKIQFNFAKKKKQNKIHHCFNAPQTLPIRRKIVKF